MIPTGAMKQLTKCLILWIFVGGFCASLESAERMSDSAFKEELNQIRVSINLIGLLVDQADREPFQKAFGFYSYSHQAMRISLEELDALLASDQLVGSGPAVEVSRLNAWSYITIILFNIRELEKIVQGSRYDGLGRTVAMTRSILRLRKNLIGNIEAYYKDLADSFLKILPIINPGHWKVIKERFTDPFSKSDDEMIRIEGNYSILRLVEMNTMSRPNFLTRTEARILNNFIRQKSLEALKAKDDWPQKLQGLALRFWQFGRPLGVTYEQLGLKRLCKSEVAALVK